MNKNKFYAANGNVVGFPVTSLISPQILEEMILHRKIEETSKGHYLLSALEKKEEIKEIQTSKQELDDEILKHASYYMQEYAFNYPKEMALLLSRTKNAPVGFVSAHGADYKGKWAVSLNKNKGMILNKNMLDERNLSGALFHVCNPGGYKIENINIPILYPAEIAGDLPLADGKLKCFFSHPEICSELPYERQKEIIGYFLTKGHKDKMRECAWEGIKGLVELAETVFPIRYNRTMERLKLDNLKNEN